MHRPRIARPFESCSVRIRSPMSVVLPANAGFVIPAQAGIQVLRRTTLGPRVRGDDRAYWHASQSGLSIEQNFGATSSGGGAIAVFAAAEATIELVNMGAAP